MVRARAIIGFAGLFVCAADCVSDRTAGESLTGPMVTATASIADFTFAPGQISVQVGTTVTWTNKDATIHTVSAVNGAFDSGSVNEKKTFQFTALQAGVFTYFCRIHPFMKGTLTVTK